MKYLWQVSIFGILSLTFAFVDTAAAARQRCKQTVLRSIDSTFGENSLIQVTTDDVYGWSRFACETLHNLDKARATLTSLCNVPYELTARIQYRGTWFDETGTAFNVRTFTSYCQDLSPATYVCWYFDKTQGQWVHNDEDPTCNGGGRVSPMSLISQN